MLVPELGALPMILQLISPGAELVRHSPGPCRRFVRGKCSSYYDPVGDSSWTLDLIEALLSQLAIVPILQI